MEILGFFIKKSTDNQKKLKILEFTLQAVLKISFSPKQKAESSFFSDI